MRPRAAHPLPAWLIAYEAGSVQLRLAVAPHPRRGRVVGEAGGRLGVQLVVATHDPFGTLALVAFLARRLAVDRAQISVVVGHASWRKTVDVAAVTPSRCLLALAPHA